MYQKNECPTSRGLVYGYVRVSTGKQSTESQKYEIEKYAESHGLKIDVFVDETVSGTISVENRQFNKIFKKAKRGDAIICTEVSRIGRSMRDIAKTMQFCIDRGISLITIKENYVLDDSPSSKLILTVYSFTAETERNLISERTREGLAVKKRMGCKLGRPLGAKNNTYILDAHRDEIVRMLKSGKSKASIARKFKVNISTLYSFIERNEITVG